MFPGVDPRMMKKAMKRLGMSQEEIDAQQVIIKTPGKNIIINNPSVMKVHMQGEDSFQITGEISEESADTKPTISEDDVQTVMEQTGASEVEAKNAIEEANGDLAEAIMKLKKE